MEITYKKKKEQKKQWKLQLMELMEKEVTMSKLKEDINKIRDSRSTFKN